MTEPYILFDLPEGEEPADREFLDQLGHEVVVCNGPSEGHPCPVLKGEPCQLVAGAHGIVFGLDLDRAQHRAVLARYKGSLNNIPIRVVARPDQLERNAPLLEGLSVQVLPDHRVDEDAPDI